MAVSASQLKSRHPGFASVGDSLVEAVIAEADARLDPDVSDRDVGVMLLACHTLVQEDAVGGGRAALQSRLISNRKIGDASVSYFMTGGSTGGTAEYSSLLETVYGRQFHRYLRERYVGAIIA